jgi:hypothetical protein
MGTLPVMRSPESKFDRIASRLKLNKEQKAEFETILNSGQQDANPVFDRLLKARVAMTDAMLSGTGQEEVDKLLASYRSVAAEMENLEAHALARICARLKPNQQGKAGAAFEEMSGIFMARDWRRAR